MGLTTWMLRLFYGVGGLAGLAVALLYFFQEKLLYVPIIPGMSVDDWRSPDVYGLDFEEQSLLTSDGVKLHSWLLYGKGWSREFVQSRPVIMFFQENAGHMAYRLPYLRLLVARLNCPVFALSYRGYGPSAGKPSEKGLVKDAQAGLDYVLSRHDLGGAGIVVVGRSLGGAVAIDLVSKNQGKFKALVLENTFTAVQDMVAQVLPPLGLLIGTGRPFNWLVTNKWSSLNKIRNIRGIPMLMMVSMLDEMVPPQQMVKLYNAQQATSCELVQFPEAHHMDAYDAAPELYWSSMRGFFVQHVETSQSIAQLQQRQQQVGQQL